jgi:hypothetical protein
VSINFYHHCNLVLRISTLHYIAQPAPRISVGVQVERSYESTSAQARQAYLSTSTQTDFIGVSVHTQVDPGPGPQFRTADMSAAQVPKDQYTQTELERSPSPMELDSPNTTPLVLSAVIPPVEDKSLSNFVPPLSSNLYYPNLFSADKSIVMRDLQQRDTTIDTVAPAHAIPCPTTALSSLDTNSKRQRQEDKIHCMSIPAILNTTPSSNSLLYSAVHTVESGAEAISKPADGQTVFVSLPHPIFESHFSPLVIHQSIGSQRNTEDLSNKEECCRVQQQDYFRPANI